MKLVCKNVKKYMDKFIKCIGKDCNRMEIKKINYKRVFGKGIDKLKHKFYN